MAMVVLVNGVPQEGILEMRLSEAGNYTIESVKMQPVEPAPEALATNKAKEK